MKKSPKPGTDSARGASKEAPRAKPVETSTAEIHCASLRSGKRPESAKRRFLEKHGQGPVRLHTVIHQIRKRNNIALIDSLPASRRTALHPDDVRDRFWRIHGSMERHGPVPSVRESIYPEIETVLREFPKGEKKTSLVIRGYELLRDLGDADIKAHHDRCRSIESYYADRKRPDMYFNLSWAWWMEGDLYRKLGLLDAADRAFRRAGDAMRMILNPDPAFEHVALKLLMRLFMARAPLAEEPDLTAGSKLLERLERVTQKLGTAFHALETARERVGYFTVLKRFDDAEAALQEVHRLRSSAANPYTEPSIVRAEIELRIARRQFPAVALLLKRYLELSEKFRDSFRVDLLRRWRRIFEIDIEPIPTWQGIYIPYLY